MGGTASTPGRFEEPRSHGRIEVVRGQREIRQYLLQRCEISSAVSVNQRQRSRIAKELGGKPRRVTNKEWEERVSRRIMNRFIHSGDHLAAGYCASGKFVLAITGRLTKSSLLQVGASSVGEGDLKRVSNCYLTVMQKLQRQGKRKMVTDSPAADAQLYTRFLGFKRQKTQVDVKQGCVRLVSQLDRWHCCRYSRVIILLAALVRARRAAVVDPDTVEARLAALPPVLHEVVLGYI